MDIQGRLSAGGKVWAQSGGSGILGGNFREEQQSGIGRRALDFGTKGQDPRE